MHVGTHLSACMYAYTYVHVHAFYSERDTHVDGRMDCDVVACTTLCRYATLCHTHIALHDALLCYAVLLWSMLSTIARMSVIRGKVGKATARGAASELL